MKRYTKRAVRIGRVHDDNPTLELELIKAIHGCGPTMDRTPPLPCDEDEDA